MNINKSIAIFLIVTLLVAGAIVFFSINGGIFGSGPTATVNNTTINLTVADSQEERSIGLSETASLGENEGMIFLFDDKAYPSFWMKGMEFPIDIIFLNEEQVVTIYKNVSPPEDENGELPLYQPTRPANRVLEVPAGFADEHNIEVEDTIELSL